MKIFKKLKELSPASKGIIIFLYSFALLEIVLHLIFNKFSFLSVVNIFFVLVITTILAFILGFSFSSVGVKKNNKYSSRRKNTGLTKSSYKIQYEDKLYEKLNRKNKPKIDSSKVKKFFGALGIFLACGIGYIPLIIFGSKNVQKITSGNYIKAEATIQRVYVDELENTSMLVYAYEDLNGDICYSGSGSSWGGITFKEGSKVTVFYNKNNPEILVNLSDTVMFFMGALFFFLGGILCALGILGLDKLVPFIFGFIFIMFASSMLTAASLAGGFRFIELFASGPLAYALFLFELLGIFILTIGIISIFTDGNHGPTMFEVLKIKRELRKEGYFKAIKEKYKEDKALINSNKEYKKDKVVFAKPSRDEIIKEQEKPKKPKKKYKYEFNVGCIPLILAAFVFGGCGIFMFYQGISSVIEYSSYIQVEAKIIRVNTFTGKEGDLLATFDYEYYVDGKRYESESSYSQSASIAPNVGDTVKIKYNKNDPAKIKDGDFIDYISLFVSFIPMGVGVFLFVWAVISMRYEVTETDDKKDETKKIESAK